MPHSFKTALCLLVAALLHTQWLRSQPEPEIVSVEFSTLALGSIPFSGLMYLKNGKSEPLRISRTFRYGPYQYTGPNPIVFFREENGPDGALLRIPVASVQVDPTMPQALYIFTTALLQELKSESPYSIQVVAMNDDLKSFPKGSYRIFNLSEHEIGCIIADQKFVIPNNGSQLTQLEGKNEVNVQFHLSSKIEDEWVSKINTRWTHNDQTRNLVFVTEDNSANQPQLKIHAVTQYLGE